MKTEKRAGQHRRYLPPLATGGAAQTFSFASARTEDARLFPAFRPLLFLCSLILAGVLLSGPSSLFGRAAAGKNTPFSLSRHYTNTLLAKGYATTNYAGINIEMLRPLGKPLTNCFPGKYYQVFYKTNGDIRGAALFDLGEIRTLYLRESRGGLIRHTRYSAPLSASSASAPLAPGTGSAAEEKTTITGHTLLRSKKRLLERRHFTLDAEGKTHYTTCHFYREKGSYFLTDSRIMFIGNQDSAIADAAQKKAGELGLERGDVLAFPMGERMVYLRQLKQGDGPLLLAIHPDESVARRASISTVSNLGGRALIFLGNGEKAPHKRRRIFSFLKAGREHWLDPNRIFDASTLRPQFLLNRRIYREATNNSRDAYSRIQNELEEDVGLLREVLIMSITLSPSPAIVVHDNRGPMRWSNRILKGRSSRISTRFYRNERLSLDEFFYVTKLEDFQYFKKAGFNTILQDNRRVPNDGSASVYFGHRNSRYYCLEISRYRKKALKRMKKMLSTLYRQLGHPQPR